MRNAPPSVIAGKPPADGSQLLGKKGRVVKVAMKEKHEPMAPKIPSCLFQNPSNNSRPKVHSAAPKNHVAPRMPKTKYIQDLVRPICCFAATPGGHFPHPLQTLPLKAF